MMLSAMPDPLLIYVKQKFVKQTEMLMSTSFLPHLRFAILKLQQLQFNKMKC